MVRVIAALDNGHASVTLDPSWKRERLSAVVLAQRDDASIAAASALTF